MSALHVRALSWRGRRERRQGRGALRPRCDTAIHMRRTVTLRSMAKRRLAGGDQPLNGLNLIGKATLNVLEAGGRGEITNVEEKRLHVCHEHISFPQEIARLRQLQSGRYIRRLNLSDGHVSSILCNVSPHTSYFAAIL